MGSNPRFMPLDDTCRICGRPVAVAEELGWARVQVNEVVRNWPSEESMRQDFFVHMECLRTRPLLSDERD
jgi:hypothetical protein